MKVQLKLVIMGIISLSCSSIILASETLTTSPDAQEKTILHQDSNSTAPIKLSNKEVKKLEDLENLQYAYIDKHYKDYELIGFYTKKQKNNFIRRVLIIKDGKTIAIEFDVTECFKKLKAKNKAIKAELDELEKRLDRENSQTQKNNK